MPRLSIIIPVFNRAHCISRALAGVSKQGAGDLELIIGDDASTDDTWEVVRREFPSARLARLEVNAGAAAARNAALLIATGEYLAFLDSDDEWLPGKLAAQLDCLEKHPEVVACATSHFYELRDGGRREVIVENPSDWSVRLQSGQPFHGASTPVVRRSVLESVGMQDESLRVLEDWDWMLRIAQKHRVHVLPEPLALIHENSPSNADFTFLSTERFLAKHDKAFSSVGAAHRRNVISQHWENAARCFFRHSRNREGLACVVRSLAFAPARNPALVSVLPFACIDGLIGSQLLRRILRARGGYSIL
jgi:glycosyltransferase involved in cell wall biosynthesis